MMEWEQPSQIQGNVTLGEACEPICHRLGLFIGDDKVLISEGALTQLTLFYLQYGRLWRFHLLPLKRARVCPTS
jgi:hypothetical protein